MNPQTQPSDTLFPGWKSIVPPPPGYFHVLRRSFDSELHVLILVIKTKKGYRVKSCVDQNTLRGIDKGEGHVSTFPEVVELVRKASILWGEPLHIDAPVKRIPARQLYYADKNGKLSGPVTREELFVLLDGNGITWDAQAWDGVGWVPIMKLLGFPAEP